MSRTRFLAGDGFNYLSMASVTATDEHPDYPLANLFDGRPSRPFQFEEAYDNAITADLGEALPVDFFSIHGHNLDPAAVVELRASDDGFSSSDVLVTALVPRQPSLYGLLPAPLAYRWWRIQFPGWHSTPIQLGEAVLGLSQVLAQSPRYPVTYRFRYPQIDNDTPAGEKYVTTLSRHALRTVSMEFRLRSPEDLRQLRDQLYGAARGEASPIVLVPLDDDPDVVIYGRLAPNLDTDLAFLNQWSAKVEVEECPFPLAGGSITWMGPPV
jgi:hypothetical protein